LKETLKIAFLSDRRKKSVLKKNKVIIYKWFKIIQPDLKNFEWGAKIFHLKIKNYEIVVI
jgi:hypothetical protein